MRENRLHGSEGGGTGYPTGPSYPYLLNCTFIANSAGFRGGAIVADGSPLLVNCLFRGNKAGHDAQGSGGAPSLGWGSARVLNCTFVGNAAGSIGGAVVVGLAATIENCFFWANRSSQYAQILLGNSASLNLNYNCIQGWTGDLGGIGGVGNFGDNPLFVQEGYWDDPGTPDDFFDDVWIAGDEHLRSDSPCVNAGDPTPSMWGHYDLDRHARILCNRLDMGAYEFGIGDYDCDDVVDLVDFANWRACMTGPVADPPDPPYRPGCEAFDFNADDAIDLSDFAAFQRVFTSEP